MAFQLTDNFIDRPCHVIGVYVTFAQRNLKRPFQFITIENRPTPIALNNSNLTQLDAFKCGKSGFAFAAKTTATDRGPVFSGPRILYLCIFISTKRTNHERYPPYI
jgi:hypothetical protein